MDSYVVLRNPNDLIDCGMERIHGQISRSSRKRRLDCSTTNNSTEYSQILVILDVIILLEVSKRPNHVVLHVGSCFHRQIMGEQIIYARSFNSSRFYIYTLFLYFFQAFVTTVQYPGLLIFAIVSIASEYYLWIVKTAMNQQA
jgi:hypothetical protein